jgi:hypothetical protein
MTSNSWAFVLGLLVLAAAGTGVADDRLPMCVKLPVEPAVEADRESVDYGVGLIFREYDLNGDGHPDFMTGRQIDRVTAEFPGDDGPAPVRPLFYWVDRDADSAYDEVWIDQGGRGQCDEIVLYQQHNLLFTSHSEP